MCFIVHPAKIRPFRALRYGGRKKRIPGSNRFQCVVPIRDLRRSFDFCKNQCEAAVCRLGRPEEFRKRVEGPEIFGVEASWRAISVLAMCFPIANTELSWSEPELARRRRIYGARPGSLRLARCNASRDHPLLTASVQAASSIGGQ